jgi:hypothetical protein
MPAPRPEQEGCFLCHDEFEVGWFVGMNDTGGPVDGWVVDGIDAEALLEFPEGHSYLPTATGAEQLTLVRRDVGPAGREP